MKCDIILCGVGGQGILSIATLLDRVAMKAGQHLKQAEVHGMAQRGGAVQSHLRLSDAPIHSDLIPTGQADLLLSVEPMESLRYLDHLKADGMLVSSASPFVNISNYPQIEEILQSLRRVKNHVLVDTRALAKEAGHPKTENTVMLGAASPFLPLSSENLKAELALAFETKGPRVIEANQKAYDLGREASLSRAK
jgi:indolepyruvate ferredoxin oxidoreductase, beta subunit